MCHCQSERTQPWEVSHEFGKEILRLESGDHLYHWVLGEILEWSRITGYHPDLQRETQRTEKPLLPRGWCTHSLTEASLLGSLLHLQGGSWGSVRWSCQAGQVQPQNLNPRGASLFMFIFPGPTLLLSCLRVSFLLCTWSKPVHHSKSCLILLAIISPKHLIQKRSEVAPLHKN